MKRTRSQKEQLEDQCFDLERETNVQDIQDDLNEENVEETTLNYATKVAKSEVLVQKALEDKSVKCFNIDTKICHNISAFSKTLTQFIRTENKIFNPKLFAEKLITLYNPAVRVDANNDSNETNDEIAERGLELEDFYQLGKQLPNLINQLPIFHFTYGSFVPQIDVKALVKERKQRTKRNDFNTEETVKPKDYDESKEKEDDVVTEEIEHLLKKIQKKVKNSRRDQIDFYDAIIDKDCLTSSVTNIFHSAFMVKEGMLRIEAKDGKNLVRAVTEEEASNVNEMPRKQQVLRFNKTTFDNWRKIRGDY